MMLLSSNVFIQLASAFLLCPPDVVEQSAPMFEPLPKTQHDWFRRRQVDAWLQEFWIPSSTDNAYNSLLEENMEEFDYKDGSMKLPTEEHDEENISSQPTEFTYGEVSPIGARQLFHHLGITTRNNAGRTTGCRSDTVFMDMGSGAGKLVVQAALDLPNIVSRSIGVELSSVRHRIATESFEKLQTFLENDIKNDGEMMKLPEVIFLEQSLLETDVSKVTHAYVSSLCFPTQMMKDLSLKLCDEAAELQSLASLQRLPIDQDFPDHWLTTTFPLEEYVEMSWTKPRGCKVFVYRKALYKTMLPTTGT